MVACWWWKLQEINDVCPYQGFCGGNGAVYFGRAYPVWVIQHFQQSFIHYLVPTGKQGNENVSQKYGVSFLSQNEKLGLNALLWAFCRLRLIDESTFGSVSIRGASISSLPDPYQSYIRLHSQPNPYWTYIGSLSILFLKGFTLYQTRLNLFAYGYSLSSLA